MSAWPETMKVGPVAEWRTIPGFPDYEVSDAGEVRRDTSHRGKPPIGVLRIGTQSNGYRAVNLYREGVATRRTVHTLVYEAFVGPRDGIEVNHVDGDKSNNSLTNLEAATSKQNKEHASRTGLAAFGERNAATKLTDAEVTTVRETYAYGGVSQRSLAGSFGVSQGHISDLVRGVKRQRVSLAEAKLREAGLL